MNDQQLIQKLLTDDIAKELIKKLGLESQSQEVQAELLSQLGENTIKRMTLEVLKKLPDDQHGKFSSYIGGGDMEELRTFLEPYVGDVDVFMQTIAMDEFNATLALLQEKNSGN